MSRGKAILENPIKLSFPKIEGDKLDKYLKEALRPIFPTMEDLAVSNVVGETRKERRKKIDNLRHEKRLKGLEEKNVSKKDVVIGFNNCFRSTQKGEMGMIFVDPKHTPTILQTFLLPLCKIQNIEIIGLENLKNNSTSYFGFQVVVFGFSKCCSEKDHAFFGVSDFARCLAMKSEGDAESNLLEQEKVDNTETAQVAVRKKQNKTQSTVKMPKGEKAIQNFHLKRTSSESRTFVPKIKCCRKKESGQDFGSDFIVF